MNIIKTTIHYYWFDVSKPDEAEQYEALVAELRATPGRGPWMHTYGDQGSSKRTSSSIKEESIELETKHLFENQWNTTEASGNRRVFDWFEGIYPNARLKAGHYLDITQEIIDIRNNTYGCGYCGFQTTEPAAFHTGCYGSEYLKESELHLTRLRPISVPFGTKRKELTDEESAVQLPIYIEAQTKTNKVKAAKKRQQLIDGADNTIRKAKVKRDGMVWLIDHGVNTDNCIYYDHTKVFTFGWQSPVSEEVAKEIERILQTKRFPYQWQFETTKGRTDVRRVL